MTYLKPIFYTFKAVTFLPPSTAGYLSHLIDLLVSWLHFISFSCNQLLPWMWDNTLTNYLQKPTFFKQSYLLRIFLLFINNAENMLIPNFLIIPLFYYHKHIHFILKYPKKSIVLFYYENIIFSAVPFKVHHCARGQPVFQLIYKSCPQTKRFFSFKNLVYTIDKEYINNNHTRTRNIKYNKRTKLQERSKRRRTCISLILFL